MPCRECGLCKHGAREPAWYVLVSYISRRCLQQDEAPGEGSPFEAIGSLYLSTSSRHRKDKVARVTLPVWVSKSDELVTS